MVHQVITQQELGLQLVNTWDDRRKFNGETQADLQSKQEAGIHRERASAYAYTHISNYLLQL